MIARRRRMRKPATTGYGNVAIINGASGADGQGRGSPELTVEARPTEKMGSRPPKCPDPD